MLNYQPMGGTNLLISISGCSPSVELGAAPNPTQRRQRESLVANASKLIKTVLHVCMRHMRWLAALAAAIALRAPPQTTPLRLSPAEVMTSAARDCHASKKVSSRATSPLRPRSSRTVRRRRGGKEGERPRALRGRVASEKDAGAQPQKDGILKIEGVRARDRVRPATYAVRASTRRGARSSRRATPPTSP